jgi:hypothetical protein
MEQASTPADSPATKPICVGLTCWRWQKAKGRFILGLGQRLGVKVQLTERITGLRRHIEAQVTGRMADTDRFIGEFVRHC